jgi:hypothetical protein
MMREAELKDAPEMRRFFTLADGVFVAVLVAVFIAVVVLGTYNYQEAAKTETAKREAEAVMAWLESQAPLRDNPDYPVTACGPALETASLLPPTWEACRAYFLSQPEFRDARNPFSEGPLSVADACVPGKAALRGALVFEKFVPAPDGSQAPPTTPPMPPGELLSKHLSIRVSICNRDAEPVFVGQVDF